jgi:hypothetical protein
MAVCIHPYCGRDVGSKSNLHEPDSCGKPSCDMFSRGARYQRRISAGELLAALNLPAGEQGILRERVREQVRGDDRGIDVDGLIRELRGEKPGDLRGEGVNPAY